MNITEILSNIFSTTNERLKNPFVGSFLISWIAFNWKPLSYYIFSNDSMKVKIDYIDANFVSWWSGLLIPIVISIIYIAVLPHIMYGFDLATKWSVNKRKDLQNSLVIKDYDRKNAVAKKDFDLEQERAGKQTTKVLNDRIELMSQQLSTKDELIKKQVQELDLIHSNFDNSIDENNQIVKENLELKNALEEAENEVSVLKAQINIHSNRVIEMFANPLVNRSIDKLQKVMYAEEFQTLKNGKNFINSFIAILAMVERKESAQTSGIGSGILDYFIKLEIIRPNEIYEGNTIIREFEVTPKGWYLLHLYLKEQNGLKVNHG